MGGLTAGLRAHLDACFSVENGRRRLQVSPSPALELRGPFGRGAMPCYYLRNTTCGVFAGDSYDLSFSVADGARVQVAASSATKVHTMPAGSATVSTVLRSAGGGCLVWGPHVTILQSGSRLRQATLVDVHDDAVVIMAEVLVFGRLANGERYRFDRLDSSLEVLHDGSPVFDERFLLTRQDDLTTSLAGHGVLVSVYALGVDEAALPGLAAGAAIAQGEAGGFIPQGLNGFSTLPNDAGIVGRCLTDSLSQGVSFAEMCIAVLTRACIRDSAADVATPARS